MCSTYSSTDDIVWCEATDNTNVMWSRFTVSSKQDTTVSMLLLSWNELSMFKSLTLELSRVVWVIDTSVMISKLHC